MRLHVGHRRAVHGIEPPDAQGEARHANREDAEAHWKIGTDCVSGITGGGRSMMTVLGSTLGPRSIQ